jgi:aldehyde dehydrogenase (NAD+)
MTPAVRAIFDRLGHRGDLGALATGTRIRPGSGPRRNASSPIDRAPLAAFPMATAGDVAQVVDTAARAFLTFREIPAPRRGELVRRIGERVRGVKAQLAELITLEAGKITEEALGEVQEMIDVCDFAVGLSRQLYGLTMSSERARHRMAEVWHPLGPVGVITAFNFPVAVWAWNAMIALVCGDTVIWKPSEKVSLTAMACQHIAAAVAAEMEMPAGIVNLAVGGPDVGQALAADPAVRLVSATGSVAMGRAVGEAVSRRVGRSLLELSGNNGAIVTPSADLGLTLRGVVFAAVGTCGQRCTSLRRLIIHDAIADDFVASLRAVYDKLPIGDPRRAGTLVGPLIDEAAFDAMEGALAIACAHGRVYGGGRLVDGVPAGGAYVRPAIVTISPDAPIVQRETFAPILYVMRYRDLDEAIAIHNGVPQGLASAIFTNDLREAELFASAIGSDCGIVNVNIGTSGAEIGGAFGGEKDTGGGRESGSDAWKAYMRRATVTANYSSDLPLAQGIQFPI